MADRIQHRRDTRANWEQYNPVLMEGEIGLVMDDPNLYKVGDGTNAWNDLPFRGFDGTLVQTIEDGDQSAVASQWANYQSDRHLQFGKASLMDVFGIDNLLTQAEIWPGYSSAEASTEGMKWVEAVNQCGAILKVNPGDVLIFQGWFPAYGFFVFAADDSNNFIAECTRETITNTCFKITVPSNSTITRICFTLYRNGNVNNDQQIAFNPQTALVVEYDESVTYPLQRVIKDSLVTPIVNEALEQVKSDPEYFSKTDGQSNLLQKDYAHVFGIENKLTRIIKGFQYANDNKKTADANAAISNDIPISGGGVLVVQGFYPKWGYYTALLDENHEIIVTNYITGRNTFGSISDKTSGMYINIPAVYNDKTVAYVGLTLWRDNNGDTNTLPFDPNFAFVGVFSEAPEVPLFNKLRGELTFQRTQDYLNILDSITETNVSGSSLTPTQSHVPGFINIEGEINTGSGSYYHDVYTLEKDKQYILVRSQIGGSSLYFINYYREDGTFISGQECLSENMTHVASNIKLFVPENAAICKINTGSGTSDLREYEMEYINVSQLKDEVDALINNTFSQGKFTSILKEGSEIYIRSKFDDSMDMVIHYSVNTRNMNFTPKDAFLGSNTLTTKQIIATSFVHYSWDSTPPFLLQNYWYLFGEHGYYIPEITSVGHDKDSSDLGSWWKTTDNKEFQLINISGNVLTFAPKITKNGGGEGKDSRDFSYGNTLSGPLTWVSGGTHDTDITITTNGAVQWLPFEYSVTKRYFVDDNEITEDGEYYGKEVKVVDVHEGLNPIAITQWNPIKGDVMVRISFTHRFFGLTVFVSNTIEVLYPMWLNYYGAFQPMGLRGNSRNGKEYHAMIVIPKVKEATAADKITVDWTKPQDCTTPNQNWAKIRFGVNPTDLLDTNNIPERIVEWQQVPDSEDYLIGFAAGYSIISGLTVNEKRKDLVDTAFQFTQDERNKLYIRCVDGTKFPNEVLPAGWIGNFNYYYSYFNPSENETKVYWYKEGGEYIIYIHAFDEFTNTKINLPEFMDGYVVQRVIESTEGSKLLTDTVSGGSLYAKFPEGSNYLVFTLK